MQYLERTLQVRSALLGQTELLATMRAIFNWHYENQGDERETVGRGNSRWAYEVGALEIATDTKVNLLLKVVREKWRSKYRDAASKKSGWSVLDEWGALEMYYDFVAGNIEGATFLTEAKHRKYCRTERTVPMTISLADNWGGTKVAVGDLGALPYFQMVVRYNGWFGHLTEGEPPLIEPKWTADDRGTWDDYTVESGRIIDLGRTQCKLIAVDWGKDALIARKYGNNLGLRDRAVKYFHTEHRLDL